MKKILLSAITSIALTQSIYATDTTSDKLADISISTGATNIYVEPIKNATVESDPIVWADFNAKLYLGGFNPTFGYSRSFKGESTEESGEKDVTENASERMLVSIPLDKIGLDGWSINYNKYVFNSYLISDPHSTIFMVDSSNTTYKTDTVRDGEQGIKLITNGESASLTIQSERFEIRKTMAKKFAGANTSYLGVFVEQLKKPWVDPTIGKFGNTTILLSEAKFTSMGLSIGTQRDNTQLPSGLSVKSMGFDFAVMDIDLTDTYKFSDKLGENMQAGKLGMKIDMAYKVLNGFLGKDSSLIFNGFVNYDYYYLDTDTEKDNNEEFPLSDDYLYGVSATLSF